VKQSKFRDLIEVLAVSTKLGLSSFGGPIAHLGYFHNEYIQRRKWMDERSYADLVALCQFLPGPASSQVGIGIGMIRAGWLGGLTAWLGFTLPSVIALVLFAFLMQGFAIGDAGWIHGLKIVAVAIVAQAIIGMGQKLAPDRSRATIAVLTASAVLMWESAFSQVSVIALAGAAGVILYRKISLPEAVSLSVSISRLSGIVCLLLFFVLLIALPLITPLVDAAPLALFDSFYRAGSLVFGGGHVVLPLLEKEVVAAGWISSSDFLAGYVGAMISGWQGALVATTAIFLPAFLLIAGALPFWNTLRQHAKVQGALLGINAAVVGILIAALYNPIWTTTILSPTDFVLASVLFVMLVFWKLPPWIVVIVGAIGGMVFM